jgi:hypothetical protein
MMAKIPGLSTAAFSACWDDAWRVEQMIWQQAAVAEFFSPWRQLQHSNTP